MTQAPGNKTKSNSYALPLFTLAVIAGGVGLFLIPRSAFRTAPRTQVESALPPPVRETAPSTPESAAPKVAAEAPPEARPARVSKTRPAASAGEKPRPEAQPLVVTVRVEPRYPSMARQNRIEGPVEVVMKVDRHGVPMDVRAVSGNVLFQAAAVQAAEQWRFKPIREPAGFRIRFDFKLS